MPIILYKEKLYTFLQFSTLASEKHKEILSKNIKIDYETVYKLMKEGLI